jgi:hypothetical protein
MSKILTASVSLLMLFASIGFVAAQEPSKDDSKEQGGHQTEVHIVEGRVTFDGAGNKTGERVVLNDGEILWTEGQRFHLISAPSVEYALLFEDSRSWASERCRKLTSLKNAPE